MTIDSASFKAVMAPATIDSAPFWAGCNQGKLLLQHCASCDTRFYYPRRLCPACGAAEPGWIESRGLGTIFSFSEVHTSFFGAEWNDELPYTVILVDLDEGPRMLSRLIGSNRTSVTSGARVVLAFVAVAGQQLPFFRLAGEPA
jgi:uncharacterized OB-fold protein